LLEIPFMENILLAIDSSKLEISTLDFACYIAKLTHSGLTGIFLEDIPEKEKPVVKQLHGLPYVETVDAEQLPENIEKQRLCDQNIALFRQACQNRGVRCKVRLDRDDLMKKLVEESRFADLIILNAETSFEKRLEGTPTHFVRELLASAECPVVIAPLSFDSVEEILFTYDGSESSVFAIKQFAHLFPAFADKTITVLQVKEAGEPKAETDGKIGELLAAHYQGVQYKEIAGDPKDQLFGYLIEKRGLFVVMGAYGRPLLSTLFRHSTAELLVKTINLPLFIAHN